MSAVENAVTDRPTRLDRAAAAMQRLIVRYERDLDQPAVAIDVVVAHRAVIAAQLADCRRRLEALRSVA